MGSYLMDMEFQFGVIKIVLGMDSHDGSTTMRKYHQYLKVLSVVPQ